MNSITMFTPPKKNRSRVSSVFLYSSCPQYVYGGNRNGMFFIIGHFNINLNLYEEWYLWYK